MKLHLTKEDIEVAVKEYVGTHFPKQRITSVYDSYQSFDITLKPIEEAVVEEPAAVEEEAAVEA